MTATRRDVLKCSAGLLAGAILPAPLCATVTDRRTPGLTDLSASRAVALMRSGALSAEDYAAALIAQAQRHAHLNAFLALDPGQVLEAARAADRRRAAGGPLGALHGLPIPVKDSVLTAEYATTIGTRAFSRFAPRRDAEIVRRLKAEGAIVMGKTNLHELSAGFTSNNEAFGPVRNPRDRARIAGGSSGGTAAAVAARIAPMGVAEDTAGSIRVPAALCGVVGLRPTIDRYPVDGLAPLTPRFDQPGPIARTVEDVALFDAVVTGQSSEQTVPTLHGVRLGVPRTHFYEGVQSEVSGLVQQALAALEEAGAELVEADIPDVKPLLDRTFVPILFHETRGVLDAWLRGIGIDGGLETILAEAGAATREQFATVLAPDSQDAIPREVYDAAVRDARPALQAAVGRYFAENRLDAMVFPTTLCTAPPIGEDTETLIDGRTVSLFDALGHNTIFSPSCGLPALTLPAGFTQSGLPAAIELDAPRGRDRRLLALGAAAERALAGLNTTVPESAGPTRTNKSWRAA